MSNDIEDAYKRKRRAQFAIASLRYEVDMSGPDTNHQQRNLRTGFKRAMRRREIHDFFLTGVLIVENMYGNANWIVDGLHILQRCPLS
mmetsp:Transcript_46926/g.114464  ORF Transcript_46926/g.114464 Transcript_46926/m.114464 type:complete len:88 (+) Transcript_46926:2937-3200(+)